VDSSINSIRIEFLRPTGGNAVLAGLDVTIQQERKVITGILDYRDRIRASTINAKQHSSSIEVEFTHVHQDRQGLALHVEGLVKNHQTMQLLPVEVKFDLQGLGISPKMQLTDPFPVDICYEMGILGAP